MLFSGTFTVGLFLDVRLVTVMANVPILQILATEMLNTKKYTRSIDLNNAQNLDADCCHSPHDAAVGVLKVAFTATSMFWYSLSLFSVFLAVCGETLLAATSGLSGLQPRLLNL